MLHVKRCECDEWAQGLLSSRIYAEHARSESLKFLRKTDRPSARSSCTQINSRTGSAQRNWVAHIFNQMCPTAPHKAERSSSRPQKSLGVQGWPGLASWPMRVKISLSLDGGTMPYNVIMVFAAQPRLEQLLESWTRHYGHVSWRIWDLPSAKRWEQVVARFVQEFLAMS